MRVGLRRLAVVAGVALLSVATFAQTPAPQPAPEVLQSGGIHTGDNVVHDKTTVIVNGNPTIVITRPDGKDNSASGSGRASAPTAAPTPAKPTKSRRIDLSHCRIRRVGWRSRINPGPEFYLGMTLEQFQRIPTDQPPIYLMMTGTRPIRTPLIEASVGAVEFEREVHCAEQVQDDCVEYDISTPDLFGRHLTRYWAGEWEHLERQGLLEDPDRLMRTVRCFSEDTGLYESQPAQAWTLRLKMLAGLLEQPQSLARIGAAQHHTLTLNVLERWAHLLILRSSREPLAGARIEAATLFSRAADLEPKKTWLRKAAVEEYRSSDAWTKAIEEQQKLLATLEEEPTANAVPAALQSAALTATLDLVSFQAKAGQFDAALSLLNDVRSRLDTTAQMDAEARHRFKALAYMFTGEIYAGKRDWQRASEYYEAAADVAGVADTPADDPLLEPRNWLLHAGGLGCFAPNSLRIARLDRRIRDSIAYFRDDRQEPTWEIWRYLMARWWAFGSLNESDAAQQAQVEADRVLERLLQQPVVISRDRSAAGNPYNDDLGGADRVAPLNGLLFGLSLSGGVFPALNFVARRTDLSSVPTPQLYRSILEYIARASQSGARASTLNEAAEDYAFARGLAAELAKRIPRSGAFLQIALLRAEARFRQEHNLAPNQSVQDSEDADALEINTTCDDSVRKAYANNRNGLAPSPESIQMQTSLGTVSLACPLTLGGARKEPIDGTWLGWGEF